MATVIISSTSIQYYSIILQHDQVINIIKTR